MTVSGDNIVAFTTIMEPRAAAAQPSPPAQDTPLRVLIVDDTPEDRTMVRFYLEPLGYLLSEADNSERGLQAVAALRPDCIVLAYRMPDFDGAEVLEKLRRLDGELGYAVVMLTGSVSGESIAKLLQAGALDYLDKENLSADSLRSAVHGAVGRFRLMQERRAAEERNAQLAALVTASSDAIFSIGVDHNVRSWNPGAAQLFGYSEAEAVGQNIDVLIVPEDKLAERLRLHGEVSGGQHAGVAESVRRHKDGSLIPVEINASPMWAPGGGVVGISVVMRDIGERKRIERERLDMLRQVQVADAARRDIEAWLELAWSASAGGAWHWDLIEKKATVSKSWRELFGFQSRELVTFGDWLKKIHPDDRQRVFDYHSQLLANGDDYEIDFRLPPFDNRERWVSGRGRIERDETGRAVRMLGINLDMTERKRAEVALREAKDQLTLSLHAAAAGIWNWNIVTDEIFWSPENYQLFDMAPDDDSIHYDSWLNRLHPADRESASQAVRDAIEGKTPNFKCEFKVVGRDGKIKWLLGLGRVDRAANGAPLRLSGINLDITDRKLREQHIEMLMREVTHRAKNMLGVVQAIARQTAAASRPQDFVRHFSERIAALAVNHDLLVDGGWKGVELLALVRSQLSHFSQFFDSRVSMHGLGMRVSGPAAQAIGMALHELATNAAKYGSMSNRQGRVEIGWRLEGTGENERFIMSWREQDGPIVGQPARRGFGSSVIDTMIAMSFGADVALDYAPAGFTWRLDCPAVSVLEH
jgi:PAS domain S-box-containing protein